MGFSSELPPSANTRSGPGWWMDEAGAWQPPEQWPEDTPPIEGWTGVAGAWTPPAEPVDTGPATRWNVAVDERTDTAPAPTSNRLPVLHPTALAARTSAAQDRRGLLTVIGALGAAAILLVVAVVLISQAGATDDNPDPAPPTVVFAAESEADRAAARQAATANAPSVARARLDTLDSHDPENLPAVDSWPPADDACPSVVDTVLAHRSTIEVTLSDNGCTVTGGLWTDRWLGSTIGQVERITVEPLIPVEVVVASGGADWDDATRASYVNDTGHPATLHVVTRGGGHNPNRAAPDVWRPAVTSAWCGYAVDWVTVKHRWNLTVSDAERDALVDMLDTCSSPGSIGADPGSIPINVVPSPEIGYVRR